MTIPRLFLTDRFTAALQYAVALHGAQGRKHTPVPYAAHLLGVAGLVLECATDEDVVIAALLHDAAEDQGGQARLADIAARFGPRVAAIVEGCSDSLAGDRAVPGTYLARKRGQLAKLPTATPDVLLVNTADKVHNTRALVVELQNDEPAEVFRRYTGTPAQTLWYYEESLRIALERSDDVPAALLTPLRTAVAQLRHLLRENGLLEG